MEETGKPMRGRFGKKAAKKAPAKKTAAKKAPAKKVAKKTAKKATKKSRRRRPPRRRLRRRSPPARRSTTTPRSDAGSVVGGVSRSHKSGSRGRHPTIAPCPDCYPPKPPPPCTPEASSPIPPKRSGAWRSEEHTSELQSLMRISYAA